MAETERRDISRLPRSAARTLALPRGARLAFPAAFPDWRSWVERELSVEVARRRLFPWIAVSFGLGILLFFEAEGPSLWAPAISIALCLAAAWLLRRNLIALAVLIGFAALSSGFAAGVLRSRMVAAPVLARVTIAPVTGFVEAVEERIEGRRLLLRLTGVQGVAPADTPRFARVSARKGQGLEPGQFIEAKARLLPPPQPAWPGGYDFGRDARFKGIGAVGSLLGAAKVTAPPGGTPWSLALTARIDGARNALTQRIASAIGGPAGGVGAALVTGKRGLIGEPTNDVLRAAGIYHIVTCSPVCQHSHNALWHSACTRSTTRFLTA